MEEHPAAELAVGKILVRLSHKVDKINLVILTPDLLAVSLAAEARPIPTIQSSQPQIHVVVVVARQQVQLMQIMYM